MFGQWQIEGIKSLYFTSMVDLDKMRNEYDYEYEYGYNNFILVLNCRHETSWKA